jgi:hypothetical protein
VGENVFVEGETSVSGRRIATIGSMMAVRRPRASLTGAALGYPPSEGEETP